MSRHALFALLSVVLLLCPTAALRAGSITYDINNYSSLQNGWTLSGTITTDGTIGAINNANITAWNFTMSEGATTYSASSVQSGSYALMYGAVASSTQITLSAPDLFGYTSFLLQGPSADYTYIRYHDGNYDQFDEYFGYNEPNVLWDSYNNSLVSLGSNWVIATAEPAASPEPASVTLMLAGIGGMAGYGLARRRRQGPALPSTHNG